MLSNIMGLSDSEEECDSPRFVKDQIEQRSQLSSLLLEDEEET